MANGEALHFRLDDMYGDDAAWRPGVVQGIHGPGEGAVHGRRPPLCAHTRGVAWEPMENTRLYAMALLGAALLGAAPATAAAQATDYDGAAALGLSLRRLGTTGRVLMIGAHPDDEDTQLLSALALGHGADVAYLSLTRGEGGQNGIGPELGEALGLLRTEELLAARRVEGASQYFTRAYDFGFSKNADEAFRHWPRDSVLKDVVQTLRTFRPDVVVAVFSGTPADGHGQHQVSAILAREAFDAAGDPARFPEQIAAGLRPWRPARFYRSQRGSAEGATVRIALGDLDPLLGRSYFQLAMASRSRHRSQDMGRPEPAGPRWGYLVRVVPAASGPESSIFTGVDSAPSLLAERAGLSAAAAALREYETLADRARNEANPLTPGALVPDLARALDLLRRADAEAAGAGERGRELRFRLAAETEDARGALARAAGLRLDAVVSSPRLVPGQAAEVEVSLWNGGAQPVQVAALAPALPARWTAEALDSLPSGPLATGALATRRFRIQVPADAPVTEPYFLRSPRRGDLYAWPSADPVAGLPFAPEGIRGAAAVRIAGVELPLDDEATFRDVDPRQGELRRPVMVVPAVSVSLDPAARVLPLADAGRPLPVRVRVASEDPRGIAGTLRLRLPAGWRAEPESAAVRFAGAGESREVEFSVRAPAGLAAGDYTVSAVVQAADGRSYGRGFQMIDYPHVRPRPLYHDAVATLRAADVRVPAGLRVAYVTGAGEAGPGVLAQIGIHPDLLDAAALAGGDLSRYDVIVTGSRAFEVRPDLRAHDDRLMEYVRGGGTLVVQYFKFDQVPGTYLPFPVIFTRPADRVTDEASPVTLLAPDNAVLSTPNRITERDFQGWNQDRALYVPRTFDPAFTPVLATADPGEAPLPGSLLVARYGRGTLVYTGLAFFRQLPEGVPGAWRLFANLLALGAHK
ncbi:MAG: mycothiol conjugate amidase Mca [Gemmatimonadetes bacterium]|nr:mycothiol conjugate amidase Mca [Gemmatimonadota bacterium]